MFIVSSSDFITLKFEFEVIKFKYTILSLILSSVGNASCAYLIRLIYSLEYIIR